MSFLEVPLGKVGLYDVLVPIGAIAVAPGYLLRSLRHPEYRAHVAERFGLLPPDLTRRLRRPGAGRTIWIQAVSVGEVFVARRLLEALAALLQADRSGAAPRLVISSTTPAGREAASGIRSPLLEGAFHFPIDWSPFVRRVLDTVSPAAFISVETEIWPGLLRQCALRGVPALIVNGRISAISHARYHRFRSLLREALAAVRLACMQSAVDAERASSIGIPEDRIVVTGNMKFDPVREGERPADDLRRLLGRDAPGERSVLVAGSTSAGEEEMVLEAFERLSAPGAVPLLVLAPRHRERFDEVARLLERRGMRYARRGAAPAGAGFDVLLLDTLGELAGVYSLAAAAFVGGSLVPRGGQNLIEPAAHGVPVLFGPHTENFAAVAAALIESGGGRRVEGAAGLARAFSSLLADVEGRRRAGEAARALVEAHRGATERTIRHILPFIG